MRTMMLTADTRLVDIAVLVYAIISLSIVLGWAARSREHSPFMA